MFTGLLSQIWMKTIFLDLHVCALIVCLHDLALQCYNMALISSKVMYKPC